MLPLKKIVWPTDFSVPAYEGLKIATELAVQFSAEMLLVHVVAPLPTMQGGVAPTGWPAWLNSIQRVLVVPWSIAATYLVIVCNLL